MKPIWERRGMTYDEFNKLPLRRRVYLNGFWWGLRFDLGRLWNRVKPPRIDHDGLFRLWIKERAKRQWAWSQDPGACFDDNDRWYK